MWKQEETIERKKTVGTHIKDGTDGIQSVTFSFQVQLPMYVVKLPIVAFQPTLFVL